MKVVEYSRDSVTDIMYLHEDGSESVKLLGDMEVIRMPIMIQQVLETVWGEIMKDMGSRMFPRNPNCRWLKWVKESQANYGELWNYGMDIIDEHFFRFGARNLHPYKHGSALGFERLQTIPSKLPDVPMTPMPLSVQEARELYKMTFEGDYSNRGRPEWLKSNSA